MTTKEKIIEFMKEEIPTLDLVQMHNNYCVETNNPGDEIYSMDMWEDIMDGFKSWDIATKVHFGEFNPFDEYFTFDGYGNIRTINKYVIEDKLYLEDMAQWMIENQEDLGYSDYSCGCCDLMYIVSGTWEEDQEGQEND